MLKLPPTSDIPEVEARERLLLDPSYSASVSRRPQNRLDFEAPCLRVKFSRSQNQLEKRKPNK